MYEESVGVSPHRHPRPHYPRTAEILERLAEIVREIERRDAICDERLADAIKFRRAWTDPYTWITYSQREEHSKK